MIDLDDNDISRLAIFSLSAQQGYLTEHSCSKLFALSPSVIHTVIKLSLWVHAHYFPGGHWSWQRPVFMQNKDTDQ